MFNQLYPVSHLPASVKRAESAARKSGAVGTVHVSTQNGVEYYVVLQSSADALAADLAVGFTK